MWGQRQPTLSEQAALEEETANRAADVARLADAMGQTNHATMLWRIARRARVQAILLCALAPPRRL